MMKKLMIPVILALAAALVVGGVALAAGNQLTNANPLAAGRAGRVELGIGQVVAVSENQFTIQRLRGDEVTVQVGEKTKFYWSDGRAAALADLAVGRWVMGTAGRQGETITARRVILLPEGFDPTQVTRRSAGEVTAVGDDEFTLKARSGEELTVAVTEETIFLGQVQGLEAMESGMVVAVGLKEAGGELIAVTLGARARLIKHAGAVTAVAADAFSIQTRQGEKLTFTVDADTQFFSRDEAIQGLTDLQPEMIAAVGARQLEDGSYLAVRVAASERPQIDLKKLGRVISLSETTVTIEDRSGQEYTFLVDDTTRFRSRGGQVNGLGDLKIGKRVFIAAAELGDGQYLARLVAVGRPKR
jgi:hypothetical protein